LAGVPGQNVVPLFFSRTNRSVVATRKGSGQYPSHRLQWMRRSRIVAGISLCTVVVVGQAWGLWGNSQAEGSPVPAPWPTALHDARHSATATAVGPQTGNILWSRQLEGNVTPGPVVGSDGTIYLASNAGILHAIDPASGRDLWTVDGGGPATGETDLSTSPLVLPDGSLLWPGPADMLFEISPSGSVLWTHRFSGQVLSPVRSGSTVYVVAMDGTLTALRLGGTDPTVAWSLSLGHTSFGSPVLAGPRLVVTTAGSAVIAVEDHGTRGVIDWRRALSAEVEVSASTDAEGDVFIADNKAEAYSFTRTGHLNWTRAVGHESYSSSSVTPTGLLYIGDNGGNLNVVRSATGSPVRVIHAGGGLWAGQVIDQRGDVYLGTRAASIVGFSASGRLLFRIPVSADIDSYPALTANGTLIVGDQAGTVYAIGTSG